jgi:hypothetical protein
VGAGKKTNIILFNTFVSMDDFQIVVYVILVVIYIISRVMKAKKKASMPAQPLPRNTRDLSPSTPVEQPKPFTPSSDPRQMTFEDLLKEFTGYNEKQAEVITERPAASPPVKSFQQGKVTREQSQSYDDRHPYENDAPYEDTPSYESAPAYEQPYSYDQTESYETLKSYDDAPSTSQTVNIEDIKPIDENKERFRAYESRKGQNVHTAIRFRNLFNNNITLKDAIIMKEIFDTKYF